MYTAEETLSCIKASENWQIKSGPDTKKRRSVGDIPASSAITHSTNESQTPFSFPLYSQSNPPHPANGYANGTTNGSANGDYSTVFTNRHTPTSNSQEQDDIDMQLPSDGDRTPSIIPHTARNESPMIISLDNITGSLDPAKMFSRASYNGNTTSTSAPTTSHADHIMCPTCGKAITDSVTIGKISTAFTGSPSGSPLVVPPGPLAAAAFESGMSAVEELRLLKAQVQDVARVCNAVARGDLSQKITVPVQGVVMVQLKDVINTMVFVSSI
jgi:osomolarity two-component system sensor histidine kinase NIK1